MTLYLLPEATGSPEARRRVARRIEALTDDEMRRVTGFARSVCRARRKILREDGEDLSQEAILRTLDGRRSCGSNVDITIHLKGAIRSIAHQKFEQEKMTLEAVDSLARDAITADIPDTGKERAREIVRKATALLSGDNAALQVLDSMLSGQRPEETRRILGMDNRSYNAARQRIRRRVVSAAESARPMCRHRTFSGRQAS